MIEESKESKLSESGPLIYIPMNQLQQADNTIKQMSQYILWAMFICFLKSPLKMISFNFLAFCTEQLL